MPTSPRTWRLRMRALAIAPLVLALTALSSCGDRAHTNASSSTGHSIGHSGGGPVGGALERRTGPATHLLAAHQMPTAGADWSGVDTAADDATVQAPCHLTSLVDIGAVKTVRRSWSTSGSSPSAVQVVGRFADSKSAWRAHQVLVSWREACGELVSGEVGPLRTVPVATGVGQAYRVAQGDGATDVGILRKGAYLSVVTLAAASGRVPGSSTLAKAAVRRIAQTF